MTPNIDDDLTPEELMVSARSNLLVHQPFLGLVCSKLLWVLSTAIPTACTNGIKVVWNPKFIQTLNKKQATFVTAHEVLHVILKHFLRLRDGDNPEWANICMDYVINAILYNLIQEEINKRGKSCMEMPPSALYKPEYNGWSWEDIYDKEYGNKKDDDQNSGNEDGTEKSDQSNNDSGQGDNAQDSQGDDDNSQQQQGDSDQQDWNNSPSDVGGCGAVMSPTVGNDGNALAQSDIDDIEDELNITIEQAMNVAKSRGLLNGAFAEIAIENKKPQIKWYHILKRFVSPIFAKSLTWNKLNKTIYPLGISMPSAKKEGIGALSVNFDTSASMQPDEIQVSLTEVQHICKVIKPSKVVVRYFDTKVWHTDEFKVGDTFKIPHKWRRGGTDFEAFTKAIEDDKDKPKCVIVFTDMECPFPKNIGIPTVWVATTDKVAPWGKTIKVAT